jgi:hypothetical protein
LGLLGRVLPGNLRVVSMTKAKPRLFPLLGAAALLSAALYNGYPLTFWDTRAYVEHAGTLMPRADRLIGYSLFIRAFSLRLTLWPVVVAQCLLVAWLLWRTLRTLYSRASGASYLLLMAALTLTTAAPWVAGQLMADIFTPMLVLSLWLLFEDASLQRLQRVLLLVLVGLCVSVHLTHFPIGVGLLAVACGLQHWLGGERIFARARAPLIALLAGLVGIAGFNASRTGRWTLAAGSDAFLLGHLVDTGIASVVLNEHCPERGYMLCPYRAHLPMSVDEFLWVDKLDLLPWEHHDAIAREAHRLLNDSLREHPLLHARVALSYTVQVLSRFRTGEGLNADARDLLEAQIARYAPADLSAFRSSRQQNDQLPVEGLRSIDTPVGWAMLVASLASWSPRSAAAAPHSQSPACASCACVASRYCSMA